MAKAEYIQRGENLDFRNNTEIAIEAGDIVVIGDRIAVAGCNISSGNTGSLHTVGVFEMPKEEAVEIALGQAVYYNETSQKINTTEADNILAGYAAGTAEASDKAVLVKID